MGVMKRLWDTGLPKEKAKRKPQKRRTVKQHKLPMKELQDYYDEQESKNIK